MSIGSVVLGLINGVLIGVLAVGIVLVYRSNRLLNLAHTQLGALSVQLLGRLVLNWGWNWWVAFLVCIPVGMAIGGLVDHFLVRPLRERSASTVSLLLVTLGASQLLLVFTYIPQFGPSVDKVLTAGYPQPFAASVRIGGVVLTGASLLTLIMLPILVIALGLFLRYSLLGKTIRAAASNPAAARLAGVSIRRVSLVTWMIAGGTSAIAGILQAPTQSQFDASLIGPYLLLLGLGAAALGAFVSIPMALAGGVLIGLVDQLVLAQSSNSGDGEVAVLITIVLIVLVRGKAIGQAFSSGGSVSQDLPPLRVPAAVKDFTVVMYQRKGPALVAVAVAALLPLLPLLRSDSRRFQLALIAIYALVAVSLTVAIGWAGQVSLGQFALLGVGAFAGGHLLQRGWSLPLTVVIAGVVAALFMIGVGLPALRVPGLTLAVTTLGLAVVGPDWLFHQGWLGTSSSIGYDLNVPALGRGLGRPSSQLVVYYICLAVLLLTSLAMYSLRQFAPGRAIIAVRDNEAAASAFGVTPATVKMAALALSGFIAGVAGVMWDDAWRTVTAGQFRPDISISILALPIIGGIGSLAGAISAAVIMYTFLFFISPHLGGVFPAGNAQVAAALLLGGLGLILTLHRYPTGIAGNVKMWWQRRLDRMAAAAAAESELSDGPVLAVDGVVMRFGGISVLNGISVSVEPGEIVGLIGPNGAGKTTLLNIISGRLRARSGRILVGGVDVTEFDPEMRAGHGLSRSFQDARLFPGLTVRETIQVAVANRHRVGTLAAMAATPWVRSSEASSRSEAEAIIDRFGLTPWHDSLTSQLSTGTRRICDLAAQVAARPRLLLLDEPTAGVAQREAEAFGPLLRSIRAELDCAIVIVEHDIPLLMGLCDRIYALAEGQVIASGTPLEIRSDPAVVASYLGTDSTAIDRSGSRAPTTKKAAARRA